MTLVLFFAFLLKPDRHRTGVSVELLHRAERLDMGPDAMKRALRIFHDAGAAEKLVDGEAGKRLGRAARPQPMTRPGDEVAGGHGRKVADENSAHIADMRGPLTRVLDDQAEVFRRVILDDADGFAD